MLLLDKLWYGTNPNESYVNGDSEYFSVLKHLADIEDKLNSTLPEAERNTLAQLIDEQNHVSFLGEKDAFISGVRFGVKLMADVLL